MQLGLTDKVMLITGGGSGIGRACALGFAEEGARIAVADLSLDAARETVRLVVEAGGRATSYTVNVTAAAAVARLFDQVATDYGRLDALVHAAGIFDATPIADLTSDGWDRVVEVNLRGTFLCGQAAARVMRAQNSGVIILMASVAGQIGGMTSGANYAASKAGVLSFTKSLAKQLLGTGVRVNAINPGTVRTPMTAGWPEAWHTRTIALTPLGREAEPEEIAAVAVFLASDKASYIHGTHIDVNGGFFMD